MQSISPTWSCPSTSGYAKARARVDIGGCCARRRCPRRAKAPSAIAKTLALLARISVRHGAFDHIGAAQARDAQARTHDEAREQLKRGELLAGCARGAIRVDCAGVQVLDIFGIAHAPGTAL